MLSETATQSLAVKQKCLAESSRAACRNLGDLFSTSGSNTAVGT